MEGFREQGRWLLGLVWSTTKAEPREHTESRKRRHMRGAMPTLEDIPTEIRLEILRHLFHNNQIQVNASTVFSPLIMPPITLVSRLLRRESLEAYEKYTQLAIIASPQNSETILPGIIAKVGNRQFRRFFFAWPRQYFTVHLEITAFPERAAKRFDTVVPSIVYPQCRIVGEDYMLRVRAQRLKDSDQFHYNLAVQLSTVVDDIREHDDNLFLDSSAILRIAQAMNVIASTELSVAPPKLLMWSR